MVESSMVEEMLIEGELNEQQNLDFQLELIELLAVDDLEELENGAGIDFKLS